MYSTNILTYDINNGLSYNIMQINIVNLINNNIKSVLYYQFYVTRFMLQSDSKFL